VVHGDLLSPTTLGALRHHLDVIFCGSKIARSLPERPTKA